MTTKVYESPDLHSLARMPVPILVKNGFYSFFFGIWGQFPASQFFLTCLQCPPFLNLQKCFKRLNGRDTIVMDGSESAAETCCWSLGGIEQAYFGLPFPFDGIFSFTTKLWATRRLRCNFSVLQLKSTSPSRWTRTLGLQSLSTAKIRSSKKSIVT